MDVGDIFIVAETGKFFQLRAIHDDYLEISNHTTYYEDAMTSIAPQARVSYDYVEAAVRIVTIDTILGMFHNGIGWKHVMTEKDPQHPRIFGRL